MASKFLGMWENQHSSFMQIHLNDCYVTGIFRTGVGLPSIDETFCLTGIADNNRICYTVDFDRYVFFTYWKGQLRVQNGVEHIESDWLMVNIKREFAWNSRYTGKDNFYRIIS